MRPPTVRTNLKGGSTFDIVKAGAISGGAAYASGQVAGANLNFAAEVTAHGVVGGAVSAASGGEFRDGFYAGAVTAAFSPAIDGIKGNTAGARIARITVAATIGGTASELSGGKFANGAYTAAFLQSTAEAAEYYESNVGQPADARPGENRRDQTTYTVDPRTGRQTLDTVRMNVVGNNDLKSVCRQSSICSKALNVVPGANATARLHDYWFSVPDAPQWSLFNNVRLIPPAVAISYGAIIGNATQGWQNNRVVWHAISRDLE